MLLQIRPVPAASTTRTLSVLNLFLSTILLLQRGSCLGRQVGAAAQTSDLGMGSFGMDWNQKASVLWDWENLPPVAVGASGSENPRMAAAPQALHSACGTISSSSEMGYGSSKSSVSASADDSSPKAKGKSMELNFAPDKVPDKNTDSGKVDDARTSPSSPVIAISSAEPVLSLKLGKRTYFEDVCGGQSVKSLPSDTSAVTPPPASPKKTKVTPNKKSYCQVEGCKVDLSSAKEYHRKHRVCEPHSKAPKVVVAGLERRFCQQCSRFHGLAEFDQKKKSCRRRLNDHNARRRKPQPEALSFGSSRLSAMFYGSDKLLVALSFCEGNALFVIFYSSNYYNGAPQPDLHRALSLLSNSWAGGGTGTGTDQHPTAQLRHAALSSSLAASSVSVAQASPAGLWQDGGAALGHHDYAHAFQAINTPGGGGAAAPIAVGQELLQLPRPPSLYDDGSSSRYDLMR
ncbi:Squamosa promoter-binding-like protein 2 [Zea mays]|uniref:Squamosa promoter-binding-like protein 2 n=1 Tax=Zea mays TaxID=4577 RepID=A0A1D6H0A2_MAIZE|nr:Squamosa promoter-binding-like protein 2 [Zea mays]